MCLEVGQLATLEARVLEIWALLKALPNGTVCVEGGPGL